MSQLPDYRTVSPPLWNAPGWPLSEPLASPCALLPDLLKSASSPEMGLAELLEKLPDTNQTQLLRQLPPCSLLQAASVDTCPLPADRDREGYFAGNPFAYWASGLGDVLFLQKCADQLGTPLRPGQALLDLGCASGRLLRHLAREERGLSLYGCDLNANNIAWMRRHLGTLPMVYFQNSILPTLPLPERSLDIVTALSVFTHIADYEEAWLLEIRRLLKPGGFALITVHTDRFWPEIPHHFTFEFLTKQPHAAPELGIERITAAFFTPQMPAPRVVLLRTNYPVNNANLYHHRDYLQRVWGRIFNIRAIIPRAHGIHQDALLLQAPPRG